MPPPRSRREKERENERPPFLFDHEGLWMAAEVFSLTFKENALATWFSSSSPPSSLHVISDKMLFFFVCSFFKLKFL